MTVETKNTVVLYGGRRVELPTKEQIWEVTLSIRCLDGGGQANFSGFTSHTIHLPRATLEAHGLLPRKKEPTQPIPDPAPTVEDLILDLLECVGVYPEQ